VFCQLEVLRHCPPSNIRRFLNDLPDTLDETYERILREIQKANKGDAHRLLHCLVAAIRPLQVEELAEILAFDLEAEGIPKLNTDWQWEYQEEAIMSACSSLVAIVKDGNSRIVQFTHFSVKEFLMEKRLTTPVRDVSYYHVELEAAHTILAQACLGAVFRLDDDIDRDKIKNFPLALYAGRYWDTHAQFGTVSSRIKDGLKCLFDADKPHLATMLWLYDGATVNLTFRSLPYMCPKPLQAVPLYYAARFGFRDLAEHLIAEHPDQVHAENLNGSTPMHVAASAGHVDILALLLEHGVDVDVRTTGGRTPLLSASASGSVEAGWYLIDHGADINARDNDDYTPLYFAFGGHVESVRMLLERGAVMDIQTKQGETQLHRAARLGNVEIVRLYLEHGADPLGKARPGGCQSNPSFIAVLFRRFEVIELLSEWDGGYLKQYLQEDNVKRFLDKY
jgi:ankyrin repeat protein